MRIVDIYSTKDGVVLVETSNKLYGIEVDSIQRKFAGETAKLYMNKLSKLGMRKVYDNGTDVKINYEKPVVLTLHDYKNINLKDIEPIVDSLKSNNIVLRFNKVKLQKTNDFSGKVIIPLSMAAVIALFAPFIIKEATKKREVRDTNTTEVAYDGSVDVDFVDKKDDEQTTTLYLSGVNNTNSNDNIDNPTKNSTEDENTPTQNEAEEKYDSLGDDTSFVPLNSGNSAVEAVYEFLKTETDFNDAAIAGIMGNIQQECNYDIESTYEEANGYISHGLCQWNAERYSNLKRFCGDNLYSVEAQLRFMMSELKNGYSYVYNTLCNVGNNVEGARKAALSFAQNYEVCDYSTYGIRQDYAEDYYDMILSSGEYNHNKRY